MWSPNVAFLLSEREVGTIFMNDIPKNVAALDFLEASDHTRITMILDCLRTTPWLKSQLLVEMRCKYPEIPGDQSFEELSRLLDSYYKQVLPENALLVTAGPCLVELNDLLYKVNQRAGHQLALPGSTLLSDETARKIMLAYHQRVF